MLSSEELHRRAASKATMKWCCFCGADYHNPNIISRFRWHGGPEVFEQKKQCRNCLELFRKGRKRLTYPSTKLLSRLSKSYNSDVDNVYLFYYNPSKYQFLCFSKNHQTKLCECNWLTSTFAPLKLDKELLPRFYQMLNWKQQYSYAFTFPAILKNVSIKPLIVMKKMSIGYGNYYSPNGNSCTMVSEKFEATRINCTTQLNISRYYNVFDAINSKILCINAKDVILWDVELHAHEFLKLISWNTRRLQCDYIFFKTAINFSEILEAIPNIEELECFSCKCVQLDEKWKQAMLKLDKSGKLKILDMEFRHFALNIKEFGVHLKETMMGDVAIESGNDEILNEILSKYSVSLRQFFELTCFRIKL